MINKDKNLVFAFLQVVVPSFKNYNISQKLLIVGFVQSFHRDYLLRNKDYSLLLTNFKFRRN